MHVDDLFHHCHTFPYLNVLMEEFSADELSAKLVDDKAVLF